jgi:hypothetical protein
LDGAVISAAARRRERSHHAGTKERAVASRAMAAVIDGAVMAWCASDLFGRSTRFFTDRP